MPCAQVALERGQVLLALWVPKLRGPSGDMLVHHLATLSLATLGAGYGYLEYYAPFFFGFTEISSVRRPRWAAELPCSNADSPQRLRCRWRSWTSSSFTRR